MRHVAILFALSSLGACTDGTEPTAMAPCAEEPRADALQVGDTFEGQVVTATVTELQPAPPTVGVNDWDLTLEGLGEDCQVQVETLMPDHGHGSDAGTLSMQGEDVQIRDLEISMGGYWEVSLQIDCAGAPQDTDDDVQDTVTLELCVDA